MDKRKRTVGGVELEAVRFKTPCPHWRIKVVKTGYIFESGVFVGCQPLDDVWYNVEKTARLRGESWARETLSLSARESWKQKEAIKIAA